MVKIERGKTIFESNAQTLVNTINCVGVMGKGLALEFKNRYPEMFDKYKSFCDKGVFKPGVLWIYKAKDGKWILNFPTKIDWRNPSEKSYIREGLKKFVEIWEEKEIKSIAFPLLGCKNGGLDPDEIIPLMERYLNKCEGLDVTIYDDREPETVDEPETDSTDEFFGDDKPKEIVIESEPLAEEEPPKPTDEVEEKKKSVSEEDRPVDVDTDMPGDFVKVQEVSNVVSEEKPLVKYSEEQEILNEIVAERRAMNDAVDKILDDFAKSDNSPEYRKKIAKKIIHVINRRGFPSDSVFQI